MMQERQREFWEYDHYLEGEIAEMVELYVERGMSRQDAETVVKLISPHRAFFVDVMTVEELGLAIPADDDSPWKDGLVTFSSFVIFGTVPLLGFVIFPILFPDASHGGRLLVACALTMFTLFLLGAVKSHFSPKPAWRSGLEMVAIGMFVATVGYVVGSVTTNLVGVELPPVVV